MSNRTIYTADRIFTGDNWLTDHAVIIENGRIISVTPISDLSSAQPGIHYAGCFICPAFIDLQIYGANGKLFSVQPGADSLQELVSYCKSGGAALCLPTIATNTKEVFYQCIDAVRDYFAQHGKGILGLHIEGPWINPVKRGAHIESLIHSPTRNEVEELMNYGKGVIRMITLAPEVCSKEVIDLLHSYGIIVSAGHSNATFEEGKGAFANGIRVATHLFNAMSSFQHRQPGLTGAILDDKKVMASIIPDGYHVDHAAVRIAKQVMKERLFVITDAVTHTDQGYYPHKLEGDKYEASGILSGSALTMNKAMKNLVEFANIEIGEAIRMCSLYPSRVMGMEQEYGKIAKGYNSSLLVMNDAFEVIQIL